jgi:hypothetical protein
MMAIAMNSFFIPSTVLPPMRASQVTGHKSQAKDCRKSQLQASC